MNKKYIAHSFNRAAKKYDKIAIFQQKSGQHLFKLLSIIPGKTILDAGCGTGYFSYQWKLIGKKVIALDISSSMLKVAKKKGAANTYIQADMEMLPLKNESVDLCFSHLSIQWCDNLHHTLSELYRITKRGGVIAFSTLLEGSLNELKECWRKIDNNSHINSFMNIQDIKAICNIWKYKFEQQCWLTIYPSLITLLKSLKDIGATYLKKGRTHGLMTKNKLNKLALYYPHIGHQFPLTYQLLFGILYRE
ncbi:MAG: malonyl-ACP O-methyltransferase BioC [Arsenophonus sp.]|nr:MAG: malonyl-ACP O-methyltransferase BioC [Arsenophonus sp.]